jgi:hypothetical protein
MTRVGLIKFLKQTSRQCIKNYRLLLEVTIQLTDQKEIQMLQ